jgi:glycosyltransferase involved in cell wall biosynthesis
MRIAINLLYLIPGVVGGTQTYAEELLGALAALDSDNSYALFVNEESRSLPLPDAPNFHRVICPVYAASRSARYRYEQIIFPRQLQAEGFDVLHSLGYVGPLFTPCKHIVTIHDLNYLAFKEAMSRQKRAALGFFVRGTARRADHIITDSRFSQDQIVAHLNIPPSKITVIHLADKQRALSADGDDRAAVLSEYGLRLPYLTAFSSLNMNKNIPRLLEAFAQIANEFPHQLLLIGHVPPEADLMRQAAQLGIAERIVCTGYVPDAHIPPLIQQASLFVFPSWYEGFGMPVLDAQRLGVPIVCSNAASLPEVAGDGALFFDPYSPQELAQALRTCLLNAELRADLRAKGLANVKHFTWRRTAQDTLRVYERVTGQV